MIEIYFYVWLACAGTPPKPQPPVIVSPTAIPAYQWSA